MPPTIHAAMTGPTPNRWSLIALSNATPTTAAGTNAITSATSTRRPSASRPTSPAAIARSRAKYSTTTARIAPAWIVIVYVSAASSVASVVADVEQLLRHEQVAGRGDRQVLGDAFDDAEHDRLDRRSARRRAALDAVAATSRRDQDPDGGQHAVLRRRERQRHDAVRRREREPARLVLGDEEGNAGRPSTRRDRRCRPRRPRGPRAARATMVARPPPPTASGRARRARRRPRRPAVAARRRVGSAPRGTRPRRGRRDRRGRPARDDRSKHDAAREDRHRDDAPDRVVDGRDGVRAGSSTRSASHRVDDRSRATVAPSGRSRAATTTSRGGPNSRARRWSVVRSLGHDDGGDERRRAIAAQTTRRQTEVNGA